MKRQLFGNSEQFKQKELVKVSREQEYYNLDMIISLGYRVKSIIATQFRQWATKLEKFP